MPVAVGFVAPCAFLVHSTGTVTNAEVQKALDELTQRLATTPGCHVMIDASGVEQAPGSAELRQIARDMKPLLSRGLGPIAIVTKPGFVLGVARMFSVFAEMVGFTVSTFTDVAAAQKWLAEQTRPAEK